MQSSEQSLVSCSSVSVPGQKLIPRILLLAIQPTPPRKANPPSMQVFRLQQVAHHAMRNLTTAAMRRSVPMARSTPAFILQQRHYSAPVSTLQQELLEGVTFGNGLYWHRTKSCRSRKDLLLIPLTNSVATPQATSLLGLTSVDRSTEAILASTLCSQDGPKTLGTRNTRKFWKST